MRNRTIKKIGSFIPFLGDKVVMSYFAFQYSLDVVYDSMFIF